jgi:hypothetical protein
LKGVACQQQDSRGFPALGQVPGAALNHTDRALTGLRHCMPVVSLKEK